MKAFELRQEIETKVTELQAKLEARDKDSAKALDEEVRGLEELLAIQEKQEEREMKELENQKQQNQKEERGNVEMSTVNEMRALTKKIMGVEMTDEERAVITTADNAPLFPKQFIEEVEKIKKGFGSLKEYCHVIPVTKMEGTKPVVDMNQNALSQIVEGTNIVEGTLASTDIAFKCAKVGLMDVLSAESVDDASVEIEGLVKENFAEIATVNENVKIVSIVKANATDVTDVTDYKGIQDTMDKMVPAVRNGLVLLTNEDGFAYLKNLQDAQKRPLNLVTEMGGKYFFNGKELVVVDKEILAPTAEGKNVFITANMREAVKFFDRKAITIEKWREPKNDTENISILERFDVKKGGTTRSLKKIEF
ncbi:phage major capsid protein [Niameybacter massiliensis]|uniref:Phage major capsid protein n=1 Tax=Holtiella tumoricola TaxID=3018743 RepID=A0AA42DMV2_9FIRM|nr:phage major capsid protein [Holtiella tumoricola]MDA3732112.1 phage major capsid protein [Holtiella tumoricola]